MSRKLFIIVFLFTLIGCAGVLKLSKEDMGKNNTFVITALGGAETGNTFTGSVHFDLTPFDWDSYIGVITGNRGIGVANVAKMPAGRREVEMWVQDGLDRVKASCTVDMLPDKMYAFLIKPDGVQKKLFVDVYELDEKATSKIIDLSTTNDNQSGLYMSSLSTIKSGNKLYSNLVIGN